MRPQELKLPAFHVGTWYRSIRTQAELSIVRENSITEEEPQYYWSSDGKWCKAEQIRKIKPVHPWKYLIGWDDSIIASFTLKLLEEQPISTKRIYRDLYTMTEGMPDRPLIRAELKRCDDAQSLCMFLEKFGLGEKA
ncbi:MAG: hypothetical protein ACOYON_10420 [Fimbriimonas sp.]